MNLAFQALVLVLQWLAATLLIAAVLRGSVGATLLRFEAMPGPIGPRGYIWLVVVSAVLAPFVVWVVHLVIGLQSL